MFPSQNSSFFEGKIRRRGKVAQKSVHAQRSLGQFGGRGSNKDHDRRSGSTISHPSSFGSQPSLSHTSQPRPATRHPGIHSGAPFQGNHSHNYFSSTPSLFSSFHCSQERRPKPSHHRPFLPEHPSYNPGLQNGTGVRDSLLHSGANVGMHSGLAGRLLSCSGGLDIPHFSSLCGGSPNLCVPSPPIWPFHSALGLFQNYKTNHSIHPPYSNQLSHILRRLSHPSSFQGISTVSHFLHPSSPSTSGPPYKLQKVSPFSFTDHRVSRGHFSFGHPSPVSSRLQGCDHNVPLPGHGSQVAVLQAPSRELDWPTQFRLLLCPTRPSEVEANCELDEFKHFSGDKGFGNRPGCSGYKPHSEMDSRVLLKDTCPYDPSSTSVTLDDRCLKVWLGRSPGTSFCLRDLAFLIPLVFNKLAGTSGSISLPQTFPSTSLGPLCPTALRQLYSRSLHSPPGYTEVGLTYGSDRLYSRVLLAKLNLSYSQAPQWLTKCLGRSVFPDSTYLHRMVNRPEDVLLDLRTFGYTPGRSVCHQGESPAPPLCITLPGSSRSGGERLLHPVGLLGLHLPIPSCPSSPQDLLPPTQVSGTGSPSCSLICSVKLAAQPSPQISRPSTSTFRTFSVAEDQQRQSTPPQPICVSPSRVETIRQGLLKAGFNAAAADVYLLSHRVSSTRQYQSVWTKFLSYLSRIGISFPDVSVGVVCNYLAYEATVNNLMYRTVTGYRSALRLPLYWCCGLEIKDMVSNQFLRGLFNLKPPVKSAPMPIWNINILLSFLQTDRFEPLESANFSSLVQKTLFLLLLSSGRRISDIANLSRSYLPGADGSYLSLEWHPDFRDKISGPNFQTPEPSISYLASDNSTDLSLCPVRAYTSFLAISQPWLDHLNPSEQHKFFWAQPGKNTPLKIPNLTRMFIKVVKDALADAGMPVDPKIGPHQMRKLSASHARKIGQNEDTVRKVMGFSSVKILRKNYVSDVSPLNIACVLPGGPYFPPGGDDLSDSDSE